MRCNRKQLAQILGKDVKTIDKLVALGMPFVRRPGNPQGSKAWEFDTAAVIGWMRGDRPDLDEKLHDAKARLLVAEAELRVLDYLEKVGVMHSLDDITPDFEEALINFKYTLYNIPGRVAQLAACETDEDKLRDLLQREFEQALRPIVDLAAEIEESGARSREIQDGLASDPRFAALLRPLKQKGNRSGS
jgi:phage terminase Nu1 subunit (DNA packaging protein)